MPRVIEKLPILEKVDHRFWQFDHRFWRMRKSDRLFPESVIGLGQNMQLEAVA